MPSINNIKLTVGVEGSGASAGEAVGRTKVVPISGVVSIDRKANTGEDPAIVGSNMTTGEYILFADVGGEIPLAVRPVGGYAALVKSALGTEEASPVQIGGCMRFRYTGAEASCKIEVKPDTDNEIVSKIGVKGAEAVDSNFGTAGIIDLSLADFDTLGELVTGIDGYSDYDAEKVHGADSLDIKIVAVELQYGQGKNTWVYIWFSSASSGVYRHVFTADLGSSEKPTLSLQKDGYQDNFLYAGCVVDVLTLSGALKAIIEGSATVLGFTEVGSQEVSALSLADVDPVIFYNGDFSIGEKDYDYIRNFDLSISNNHNPDGYGVASLDRQYHQKGKTEITGTMVVRLDADSFAERTKVFADTQVALSFYFKGDDIATDVPELMLIELPYCSLQNFDFSENAGVFDASMGFKVTKPKGTIYNEPITFTMLNTDSAVY